MGEGGLKEGRGGTCKRDTAEAAREVGPLLGRGTTPKSLEVPAAGRSGGQEVVLGMDC